MRLDMNDPDDFVTAAGILLAIAGALLTGTNAGIWVAVVLFASAIFSGLQLISEPGWRFSLRRLLILMTLIAIALGVSVAWG